MLKSSDYESGALRSSDHMYDSRMNIVDELKQWLVDVWHSLQQNIINTANNKRRKRLRMCTHANGQYFNRLFIATWLWDWKSYK